LSNNKALYGLIAVIIVMAGSSLALADVIFTYTGNVNVNVQGAPITFSLGPNNSVEPWVSTAVSPTGFAVNVAVTNAAEIYYYKPIELNVITGGYIYVNNVTISPSGSDLISNMYAVFNSASTGSLQIVKDSGAAPTPSSSILLSTGTYYVSLWIEPTTPVTSGSETITVSFGYNIVANSAVSIAP